MNILNNIDIMLYSYLISTTLTMDLSTNKPFGLFSIRAVTIVTNSEITFFCSDKTNRPVSLFE